MALVRSLEATLHPGMASISLMDRSISVHLPQKNNHESMARRLPIILTSFPCERRNFFEGPILQRRYSTKRVGTESNVERHE